MKTILTIERQQYKQFINLSFVLWVDGETDRIHVLKCMVNGWTEREQPIGFAKKKEQNQ
jgi:hypothetical protein